MEFNPLCQWQGIAIVNCICLPPHIYFPGITAAFPAAPRFFFTTESASYFSTTGTNINIRNPAVTSCVG